MATAKTKPAFTSENKETIKYVVIGAVVVCIFFVYRLTSPKPLTRDECYRLGSNERTRLCLQEIEDREKGWEEPTPEPVYLEPAWVWVQTSEWVWEDSEPVIYATTKNANTQLYVDRVRYKVTYSDKGAKNCTEKILDTQETNVMVEIPPNSIKRVRIPIETSLIGQELIYCVEVLSALSE